MVRVKDDRSLVKDLLAEHATKLNEMRAILEKEETYSKEHYDDLWMLHFLPTHKKVSKASDAAIKTMKFREENKLNEREDIRHKILDNRDPTARHTFECTKKYVQYCKDSIRR